MKSFDRGKVCYPFEGALRIGKPRDCRSAETQPGYRARVEPQTWRCWLWVLSGVWVWVGFGWILWKTNSFGIVQKKSTSFPWTAVVVLWDIEMFCGLVLVSSWAALVFRKKQNGKAWLGYFWFIDQAEKHLRSTTRGFRQWWIIVAKALTFLLKYENL